MSSSALPSALIPSATLACSVLFSGTEFAASYQRTALLCQSTKEGFLMRKLALLVLLVMVFCGWSSGASATPYSTTVLSDNPVAYWRMGETSGPIVDEVSGRQGTLSGGNTTGVAGAIVGDPDTAISSGPSGGTISVPYDIAMNSPTFSIELWAKFGSRCSDGTGTGNHCEVAGTYSLNIGPIDTLPQMTHSFTIWHGVTSGNGHIVGPTVEYDRWYHLVGSYNGSVQSFYVDGVLVGSNAVEFTFQNQDFRLYGGGYKVMENGTIDEVAYYNYALGADRVENHYLTGIGVIPEPNTALLLGIGLSALAVRREKR
jgi:hypothetical protein